ncbi:MAG: hypothetical protein H7146_09050 [Burkholderiaceae bacterium]|nr:hypothetical protein [Microbacteriaceae bacterium]
MRESTDRPRGTDPEPADPAAMMAILRDQQQRVDRALLAPVPWLLFVWGVAWLVGYLLLWSAWPAGNPWFQIPVLAAGAGFGVLMAASIATSAVMGMRINRGVTGVSDFAGTVYGLSWSVCGFAFFALGSGLAANGASPELLSIYFPSAFGLMAGTLYLAGAALWRDRGQLVLGIVMLAVSSVAPFAGQPGNNLVMALAGGGALLAGAAAMWVRRGRSHA